MTPDDFDQEVRLEYYRQRIVAVRDVGVLALKTLIALNSGAFVVLLTFIGNSAVQSKFVVELWNLKLGMFCFLAGIALSFLVIAYTYVASEGGSPYPQSPRKTDGWFVAIAVIVAAFAFLCFVVGVVIVIVGVGKPQ